MTIHKNYNKYIFAFFIFYSFFITNILAAGIGTNDFVAILCDIIILVQGRIGRALILIAFATMGINFLGGNVTWQQIMKFTIGVGFFLAPITIVSMLLPATIQGISGELASGVSLQDTKKYTPEYIIISVCPELSV